MMATVERREWAPDVDAIADQLIHDYRTDGPDAGNLDAIATLNSWQETARFHGEEFTEDDWVALVQELAWRAAYPEAP